MSRSGSQESILTEYPQLILGLKFHKHILRHTAGYIDLEGLSLLGLKEVFQKRQWLSQGLREMEEVVRQTRLYALGLSHNSVSFLGGASMLLSPDPSPHSAQALPALASH